MKTRIAALAVVTLAMGGCGGGGGSGAAEVKRVFVLPHVLEKRGVVTQIATGDINGDGILDLVTLRESPSKGVTLQLSSGLRESPTLASQGRPPLVRGAAGYQSGVAHTFVWDSTKDLGVCDMDHDGAPDLIVAGGSAHQVGVWRCDPVFRDGFLSPVLFDTTGSADCVATADVNGDGREDLVTLDESTGQATLLLQTSASPLAFAPSAVAPPPFGACHGLVLADFDHDGRVDILTNDPAGNRILFLFGGAAGFKLRESPTLASTGRAMAVGDVDGDGFLDVVVAAEDGKSVVCLHQNPTQPGTFLNVVSPLPIAIDEPGAHFCEYAIGDPGVNGRFTSWGPDMQPDLARMGRPTINTALNHLRTITQPGLGLVDLDGDGKLDLVCAPLKTFPISDSSPVIVFGSTTIRGGFGPTAQLAVKGHVIDIKDMSGNGGGLCVGDFDNDGHMDVVTSDPEVGELTLLYTEDGNNPPVQDFTERLRIQPTNVANDCATADVDRDGLSDVISATTTGLEIRFQDTASPGTFLAPVILLPGQDCRAVAAGDCNGDGCPDLVVAAGANGGTLLRDPLKPRSFLPIVPFPAAPAGTRFRCLALADLNGDGRRDLVVLRESPSKCYRCLGTTNGFFDVFTEVSLGITSPKAVAIDDLDGDGRPDLAVAGDGPDGSCVVLQDHLTPLKFSAPVVLSLQHGVRVATVDVDGDGVGDVVTSGGEGVAVALQSTDVPGRFLPAYALSTVACGGLAVGDLNHDGQADVCFVEVATGTLKCVDGDPDFDLLRVVSLNGLPPGEPFGYTILLEADTDGDGDFEPLASCIPSPGATTGILSVWGSTHAKP